MWPICQLSLWLFLRTRNCSWNSSKESFDLKQSAFAINFSGSHAQIVLEFLFAIKQLCLWLLLRWCVSNRAAQWTTSYICGLNRSNGIHGSSFWTATIDILPVIDIRVRPNFFNFHHHSTKLLRYWSISSSDNSLLSKSLCISLICLCSQLFAFLSTLPRTLLRGIPRTFLELLMVLLAAPSLVDSCCLFFTVNISCSRLSAFRNRWFPFNQFVDITILKERSFYQRYWILCFFNKTVPCGNSSCWIIENFCDEFF